MLDNDASQSVWQQRNRVSLSQNGCQQSAEHSIVSHFGSAVARDGNASCPSLELAMAGGAGNTAAGVGREQNWAEVGMGAERLQEEVDPVAMAYTGS